MADNGAEEDRLNFVRARRCQGGQVGFGEGTQVPGAMTDF